MDKIKTMEEIIKENKNQLKEIKCRLEESFGFIEYNIEETKEVDKEIEKLFEWLQKYKTENIFTKKIIVNILEILLLIGIENRVDNSSTKKYIEVFRAEMDKWKTGIKIEIYE